MQTRSISSNNVSEAIETSKKLNLNSSQKTMQINACANDVDGYEDKSAQSMKKVLTHG